MHILLNWTRLNSRLGAVQLDDSVGGSNSRRCQLVVFVHSITDCSLLGTISEFYRGRLGYSELFAQWKSGSLPANLTPKLATW